MIIADPRAFLRSLFDAAVAKADPARTLARYLPEPPKGGRTVVIGAGKGAAQMARAFEKFWSHPITGAVVTRYGYGCKTERIEVMEAAHPVPDANGLAASEKMLSLVSDLTKDDLVIALICGGGSALLSAPPHGFTLDDEIALNRALLASGAPISAMNAVRKHFSRIKGGRLAAATKARVVTLAVSDIPGDNAALISSGPTIADYATRKDALRMIKQYRLSLPSQIVSFIGSTEADALPPDHVAFARNSHHIIASARASLEAAAWRAKENGLEAHILSDAIEGEARDVAAVHGAIAREVAKRGRPFTVPCVILSGGETTVTIRAPGGRGGRNSEFALALAPWVAGYEITALAADTDGIDGSETNAGAFVDGTTGRRLLDAGKSAGDYLIANDSYSAFSSLGDLFETGPTGTNVNDFRAMLILPPL